MNNVENPYNAVLSLEITLSAPDDFLKIKETLQRIGISSNKTNTLWQSCHILHKRQKYYIVHFKELFYLDGKKTDITQTDIQRRDTIARLLEGWGLLKIVNPVILEEAVPLSTIKIIPYREKTNWNLVPKYTIGKTK